MLLLTKQCTYDDIRTNDFKRPFEYQNDLKPNSLVPNALP